MDNFNLKKYLKEGKLNENAKQLNENAPGFDTRKSGEPLPTLESVKAAYEAKNPINEVIATLSDILDDLDDILKTWESKEYSSDESRWKEYYQDIADLVKFHRINVSESYDEHIEDEEPGDDAIIESNVEKEAAELADMSNASQLIGKDFKQMVKNFNSKGADYDAWKEFKNDWLTVDRAIEIALEKGQA